MKKIFFAAIAILSLITSCDETTDTLGSSLTDNADNMSISVDTFAVTTKSVKVDAVYNRSTTGYLGRVLDPETGAYYTSSYIAQLGLLENFDLFTQGGHFDPIDDAGNLCNHCNLILYVDSYYGDSLTTMNATVEELQKPMEESIQYYSNFDPEKEGYVRDGGMKTTKSYAIYNRSYSDSLRATSTWMNNINIPLNDPYTDKDGKTYNNIGSYILANYRDHKENFKDSYSFIHNVLPGFYVKYAGGLGSMAAISSTAFNIHYKATIPMKKGTETVDSTMYVYTSFKGTDEVIQGSSISSDNDQIDALVAEDTHTYIKTPSSIFTEVEIPVNKIFMNHENDSLNSAKVTFQCINQDTDSKYKFNAPTTLLIVQKDSLDSFFLNAKLANYRNTFLASYTSSSNTYTFNNISSLIQQMNTAYKNGIATDAQWAAKHPDWNKLLLVPVKATYTTYSSSSVLSDISSDLSLSTVKLVGGPNNNHGEIKMSVIYSKFNK